MSKPLLFISDNPLGKTGLGRITKQVADLTHKYLSDIYRVGVAGVGLQSTRHSPYPVYPMAGDWQNYLPAIWEDFMGGEKDGIMFFIMNAGWLNWLANPSTLPPGEARTFAETVDCKKWLYVPIDSEGPGGRLPRVESSILESMDQVIAYNKWAANMIDSAIHHGVPVTPYLPHGTDSSVFYRRDRKESRDLEFCKHIMKKPACVRADLMLGCVATNTQRKDWPLCFEICQELVSRGIDVGLWAHTDQMSAYWNLPTLAVEFGMDKRVLFTTGDLSDEDMAWGYAACDAVICPGSGEGWGMSGSESLACGVPCIHGNYAGQTEYMPPEFLVEPIAFRYDGFYCNKRPAFRASDWADKILEIRGAECLLDSKYTWDGCWPEWERWFREAAQ